MSARIWSCVRGAAAEGAAAAASAAGELGDVVPPAAGVGAAGVVAVVVAGVWVAEDAEAEEAPAAGAPEDVEASSAMSGSPLPLARLALSASRSLFARLSGVRDE